MEDMQSLLRYEIPGLLSIIYFAILSCPLLSGKEVPNSDIVNNSDIIGLTGLAITIGLPIGFLIYNLYLSCEYKKFMENRIGISDIIPRFLEKTCLSKERQWWECPNRTIEEKYEIMDTGFYYDPGEKGGMKDLLERFINYYHSGRVISLYVPLVASFFASILSLCFQSCFIVSCCVFMNSLFIFILCILGIFIFVFKSKCSCCRLLRKCFVCLALCLLLVASIFAFCHHIYLFFSSIIIFISLFFLYKNVLLWNQIKELETNLLLKKERVIMEAIRQRIWHGL